MSHGMSGRRAASAAKQMRAKKTSPKLVRQMMRMTCAVFRMLPSLFVGLLLVHVSAFVYPIICFLFLPFVFFLAQN